MMKRIKSLYPLCLNLNYCKIFYEEILLHFTKEKSILIKKEVEIILREYLDKLPPYEKGKAFEKLVSEYLRMSKLWDFKEVKRIESTGHRDIGVDFEALDKEGRLWAIQAKYHAKPLTLREVSTFFANLASRRYYGGILVVKEGLSNEVKEVIYQIEKQLHVITLSDMEDEINLQSFLERGEVEPRKKVLRDYQKEAVEKVLEGFEKSDRGKLIMPPGTGKTYVALKITEKLLSNGGFVLFLCPSIALLDQTLKAWLEDAEAPIEPFVIVSDETVGKDVKLCRKPTTSADELLSVMSRVQTQGKIVVIFSTYQSIDVVEEAQKKGLKEFDLIICDEAHRTTGVEASPDEISCFKKVHHNEFIKGKRRLYMTATPRIYKTDETLEDYKIYSMDNEKIYGKEFFHYKFSDAIRDGHVADFKVIVLGINKREVTNFLFKYLQKEGLRLDETAKVYGLLKFLTNGYKDLTGEIRKVSIKKGIVFVNKVTESRKLSSEFPSIIRELGLDLPIKVCHIDGDMKALERKALLEWLREDSDEIRLLSNAKVLTEGIDVPALDLVAFLKPRKSAVDIVQALGRVVRKAPGKDYGYVFVPILVDEDSEEKITSSDYAVIVEVLDALRSYGFEGEIRKILKSQLEFEGKLREPGLTYGDDTYKGGKGEDSFLKLLLDFPIKQYIAAKALKRLGLGKKYLENWAQSVSELAKTLTLHVETAIQQDNDIKEVFEEYLRTLRQLINENISHEQALSMLVQYMLTKPIFVALFGEQHDSISKALDAVAQNFHVFLEKESQELKEFYYEVESKAKGLTSEQEKQDFLRNLYDNFFKIAFSQVAEQLGIAYTPVEVVDFMIRMSDQILRKDFGLKEGINSPDVVILEPFAGTGTFIARIVDYLSIEALKDKYKNKKLWGNEILLLPYYIAKINTELAYQRKTGEKEPFKSMLLVDSFELMEKIYTVSKSYNIPLFPPEYSEVLNTQKNTKINLIISNPPYFAKAESSNEKVLRGIYPNLRKRIEQTFVKYSSVRNKNSLYDSYVMAIRMALDRVEEGVIAFVINNGWLDGNAADGLRKSLVMELDKIYVINLRGNLRKKDPKEGENIFNVRVGICVVFLVKKKEKSGSAQIFYYDIGEGLRAKEKLKKLEEFRNLEDIPFAEIKPNEKGDWLNQRSMEFYSHPALGSLYSEDKWVLFKLFSNGLKTNRDFYAYSFSKERLQEQMERLIETFNKHVIAYKEGKITKEDLEKRTDKIEKDERKIKWDRELLELVTKGKTYTFESGGQVYKVVYRPFVNMYGYFSKFFNSMTYQLPVIFPFPDAENLVIVISNKADNFDVFMVDRVYDIQCLMNALGFPLYTYTEMSQRSLYVKYNYRRDYNLTPYAFTEFRKRYGDKVTPEDIFYYTFGMLNNPVYQSKFANELRKDIPRIPFVSTEDSFYRIAELGRELASLELGIENIEPYPLQVEIRKPVYELKDIKLDKESGVIRYNDYITISGIPQKAFEFKINGKSPVEWIVSGYSYKVDKNSNNVRDPNDVLKEKGDTYLINLISKAVNFTLKVIEIREKLSKEGIL